MFPPESHAGWTADLRDSNVVETTHDMLQTGGTNLGESAQITQARNKASHEQELGIPFCINPFKRIDSSRSKIMLMLLARFVEINFHKISFNLSAEHFNTH